MVRRPKVALAIVFGALCTTTAHAQQPADFDPGHVQMSRGALQALLARLDSASQSSAYSEALRVQSRREADLVRHRLQEGDFQVGDRIQLRVEGEQQLPETVAVTEGRSVILPTIGEISLIGVLHSELQPYLAKQLGRFLKDPIVRARALIRITVLGEVARPGFYLLPTETVAEDVLMAAGGPTREAKLTDIRVERGDERLWEGPAMEQAITQGETLDQLGIQAGDRLVVPRHGGASFDTILRISGLLIAIPATIYAVTHVF
jgi:protein involved in polysaccharide export with SLBB domain